LRLPGGRSPDDGFTLIELLVVTLIIAILAAIAVPLFYKHREKAHEAQVVSALKGASVAVEAYATDPANAGSYEGLDGSTGADLAVYGFRMPAHLMYLNVETTETSFCIETRHESLTATSPWRRAVYDSDEGRPTPVPDNCPPGL
jgi:prepilin-type N-terminal cleavage/methylation domain-containing protein